MSALDVGEFENTKFTKIADGTSKNIDKYRVESVIKSKELNSYLNEYKEEMKKRRVVFPGFRPGKLPPYAMGDVRRYIVSFGLETTFGQLCNMNSLIMCKENGDEVSFGEDSYYQEIILDDFRQYNFTKQRDSWKEGTDFPFTSEFFAKKEESTLPETVKEVEQVIDAEVISP